MRALLTAIVTLFIATGCSLPRTGHVRLGMDRTEIVARLGPPAKRVATQTGSAEEIWIYRGGSRVLVLEDDKLRWVR